MLIFQTLVINVLSNDVRRTNMVKRLRRAGINFEFVRAVETLDISENECSFLTRTAEAVWRSHVLCIEIASKSNSPTLILEDDAIPFFDKKTIQKLLDVMKTEDLDFIQLGFLSINLSERVSIRCRNLYSYFTRNNLFPSFFRIFGFKEVGRASKQQWRKRIPLDFIVNDIRYGAHSYIISSKFAGKILPLNSPAFLPADDFFVALSRAKSFKMIRLRNSCSSQDNTASAFIDRFRLT